MPSNLIYICYNSLPRPSCRNIQPELLNDAEIDPEMMIRTHVDRPFLEEHQRGSTQDYYLRLFYSDPRPTEEQQHFIDEIVRGMWSARHVIDGSETSFAQDIPRYFFITGEGGSGKTFMYNVCYTIKFSIKISFIEIDCFSARK